MIDVLRDRLWTWRHHPGRTVFVWPAIVFVVLMVIAPLGYAIYLSVFEGVQAVAQNDIFIGLRNFRRLLFEDDSFRHSIWVTLAYTVLAVTFETVLGTAIALLLNRRFRGRRLVQALLLIPVVLTPTASALIWRLLFNTTNGFLNEVLAALGVGPIEWLSSTSLVVPSLVVVDVWHWTPFITLIVLAGLMALPGDVFEAAAVDGASAWQRTRHITLPLVRPVILIAAAIRTTDCLKTFDHIFILTGGGPANASETLNIFAFKTAFEFQDFSYASAVVLVFFVLIMAVVSMLLRFRRANA